jgi:predicted  nucleic acid-binding Zn-ribbon protein
MGSALVTHLSEKVRLAATEIRRLRQEKERLTLQAEQSRGDALRLQKLTRERGHWTAERARLRRSLEKLMEKLNALSL